MVPRRKTPIKALIVCGIREANHFFLMEDQQLHHHSAYATAIHPIPDAL